MESVVMTSEEREKVESFKNECKRNWEREQYLLEVEAERKGETFTLAEYKEVNDADALAAVRAGWKSELDKVFEKKWEREKAQSLWR